MEWEKSDAGGRKNTGEKKNVVGKMIAVVRRRCCCQTVPRTVLVDMEFS